jgi:four helix bundle protein
MTLVQAVYKATATFPDREVYGLTAQMRRAAVSIPSNITEGAARNSKIQYLQFLSIARVSLSELETQILIAKDLGYLTSSVALENQADKVFALLSGLITALQKKRDERREMRDA